MRRDCFCQQRYDQKELRSYSIRCYTTGWRRRRWRWWWLLIDWAAAADTVGVPVSARVNQSSPTIQPIQSDRPKQMCSFKNNLLKHFLLLLNPIYLCVCILFVSRTTYWNTQTLGLGLKQMNPLDKIFQLALINCLCFKKGRVNKSTIWLDLRHLMVCVLGAKVKATSLHDGFIENPI